jgi:hypothetical protein
VITPVGWWESTRYWCGDRLYQAADLGARCAGRLAARRRGSGARRPLAGLVLRFAAWRRGRSWQRHRWEKILWRVWLDEPDEQIWEQLPEWWRVQVFADAVQPGRGATERAAIGAFCAARGLAPQNPAERALFFVLTGQQAQHRAVDPDGLQLAAAYHAAGEPTRAMVRQALVDAGDLDLVWVMASGRREWLATVTAEETDDLAGQLAGRRDWAGLWELARDLPLVHAVAALGRFADGWRPADEGGRALFARLAQADPQQVARARYALDPRLIRLRDDFRDGSFSPDGRWLTIAANDRGRRPTRIYAVELPDGAPTRWRARNFRFSYGDRLLCLGEAFLVVQSRHCHLVRRPGGRAETIWRSAAPGPVQAEPHAAGFCALRGADGTGYRLAFHDGAGREIRTVTLDELGITPPPSSPWSSPRLMAADPASSRLAVYLGDTLWLVGTGPEPGSNPESGSDSGDIRVLARGRVRSAADDYVYGCCFAGPERLVLASSSGIRLYHVADRELRLQVATAIRVGSAPIAIPARGEIALFGERQGVIYLDAQTLALVDAPREFTGKSGSRLWASADGRRHALYVRSFADVVLDPRAAIVAELADRPQASARPGDLATVARALRDGTGGQAARPLLELLAGSLKCRFGAEVALGTGAAAAGKAADDGDEIALDGGLFSRMVAGPGQMHPGVSAETSAQLRMEPPGV